VETRVHAPWDSLWDVGQHSTMGGNGGTKEIIVKAHTCATTAVRIIKLKWTQGLGEMWVHVSLETV